MAGKLLITSTLVCLIEQLFHALVRFFLNAVLNQGLTTVCVPAQTTTYF